MPSFSFIFGVFLLVLAAAGGALGTYHNVSRARGPRERSFAIRTMAGCWLLVAFMLAALYFTSGTARYTVVASFFIIGPALVYKWSTTLQLMRMVDERERDGKAQD